MIDNPQIPKKFKLGAIEYGVSVKKKLNGDILGDIDYRKGKVRVLTKSDWSPRFVESIFYHELAHAIFDKLEKDEMREDEHLCTELGNCIHEFMLTAKW